MADEIQDIFSFGFDKNLNRNAIIKNSSVYDSFETTNPALLTSGPLIGNITLAEGNIQSGGFESGSVGFQFTSTGYIEANSGLFRGNLQIGSGDNVILADPNDTTWRLGIGNSALSSAPFRVDKEGNLTATSATINDTQLLFTTIYGDGSDGDVTISADTSLARDMFYNDLVVNGGNLTTAGYRVFVKGTLTINPGYTINFNGLYGTAALAGGVALLEGSLGGAGGGGNCGVGSSTDGESVTFSLGGNGGDGETGGQAGKLGGTATAPTAYSGGFRSYPLCVLLSDIHGTSKIWGGGGGGGGGISAPQQQGGSGGSGGGVVFVASRKAVLGDNILASGGDGGLGRTPDNVDGGGGGGGVVVLIYNSLSGTGTIAANGGQAGGTGATAGSPGTTILLQF